MIRVVQLIVFILIYNSSFSQEDKTKCDIKPFMVYTIDNDEFSNIRATPKGEIILKLSNNYSSEGYILTVIDVEDGWLKINVIEGIEGVTVSNFEGWIHNSIVEAAVTHDLDVFDKPNGKNKVGKLIGEHDSFKIKDVYCEWIKIECKNVSGWVKSDKICGNPVTTCP